MTRTKQKTAPAAPEKREIPEHVSLSTMLSKKPIFKRATFWIVGDTPLITHAWSEKAKREILAKQLSCH